MLLLLSGGFVDGRCWSCCWNYQSGRLVLLLFSDCRCCFITASAVCGEFLRSLFRRLFAWFRFWLPQSNRVRCLADLAFVKLERERWCEWFDLIKTFVIYYHNMIVDVLEMFDSSTKSAQLFACWSGSGGFQRFLKWIDFMLTFLSTTVAWWFDLLDFELAQREGGETVLADVRTSVDFVELWSENWIVYMLNLKLLDFSLNYSLQIDLIIDFTVTGRLSKSFQYFLHVIVRVFHCFLRFSTIHDVTAKPKQTLTWAKHNAA